MKTTDTLSQPLPPAEEGFSLIELLVVTAVIAILAAMLSGSLGIAKNTAQSALCKSNLRQLQQGWFLYAHDHEDKMPPNKLGPLWNFDSVCPEGYANAAGSWVLGNAMSDPDLRNIRNGVLYSYNPSAAIYRCPADKSKIDAHPDLPRIRSYAMSYCMNGDKVLTDPNSGAPEKFPLVKEKTTQLVNPSRLFVFVDEAEQTIEDGTFFIHYPGDPGEDPPDGPHWMDVPADRHMQGCNITCADGHTEHLRWRSPKNSDQNGQSVPKGTPDFQDLRTMQHYIPDPPPRSYR